MYIIKVLATIILYYITALFGDFLTFIEVFNHNEYPPYWPPSGIAFGLIIIWGRSIWLGIAIGSLLLTPKAYWFIDSNKDIVNTVLVSLFFAVGRILEPLTGRFLLTKFNVIDNPFKNPKNIFRFIIITFVVSFIGAVCSSSGIQLLRNDVTSVYVMRTLSWYVDNVVGILLFAPIVISFNYLTKYNLVLQINKLASIFLISILVIISYFIYSKTHSFPTLIIYSLPFLILPVFLWMSFKFHLAITSFAVIIISIIVIYFTTIGVGPFRAIGDWQNSVWLLQSFLLVTSIATLVSTAAANEIKDNEATLANNAIELENANLVLWKTMENLEKARDKALESDRLKSSFIANMSHEIRTPMNAIMGLSEMLGKSDLTEVKKKEYTRLIRERSQNLLDIVNDILILSQIETGTKSTRWVPTNITKLFTDINHELQTRGQLVNGKNLEINYFIDVPNPEERILIDIEHFKIVLSNLINNAIKFTQHGGITLSCKKMNEDTLIFSVKDTGPGIAREKHNTIFKPFRQGSEQIHLHLGGTGLGLAICKGLVTLWGGKIWVDSIEGEGSTFYFTSPYKLSV